MSDLLKKYLFNLEPTLERELEKKLPEMITLIRILRVLRKRARLRIEGVVPVGKFELPIVSIVLGSEDPKAPTMAVFGGVHGLERIGSDVVIAWLHTLTEMLEWDHLFRERLKVSRLVIMPIVNPGGVLLMKRGNPNGVDLMRNSPIRAADAMPFVGGQNFSPKFWWYSPEVNQEADMEIESQAVCRLVEREMGSSQIAVSLDVHSGFGSVDRLWFPWAKSKNPPPHLEEIAALKRLFDRSYPNHFYKVEPQALQYTTHGDLWDWIFQKHIEKNPILLEHLGTEVLDEHHARPQILLPLTLELGSWMWLKKNPRQLFTAIGGFHPVQPHRLKRILRRHLTLFDFLHRAVLSSSPWAELSLEEKKQFRRRALNLWYQGSQDFDEDE